MSAPKRGLGVAELAAAVAVGQARRQRVVLLMPKAGLLAEKY
jgi:hypothetical protein